MITKHTPFTLINKYNVKHVKHFTGDFETCKTEDLKDVRVWAWGLADIFSDQFEYGNSIDSFLEKILSDSYIYDIGIHNLKFDGEYILPALFKLGYQYVNDKTFIDMWLKGQDISKVFTHNITVMGQWFNIIIGKPKKATGKVQSFVYIWDTYKLFPITLKEIGQQYCIKHKKIDEDSSFYRRLRPVGHVLSDEEILYLQEDCLTLSEALRAQYELYKKIYRTRASKAFSFFKECCTTDDGKANLYSMKYEGQKNLKMPRIKGLEKYEGTHFRDLPTDAKKTVKNMNIKLSSHIDNYIKDFHTWDDLKGSLKGGISYVNPEYKEKNVEGNITVLDVSSMYPAKIYNCKMPFGKFTYNKGKPEEIKNTTWIACARVSFKLKQPYNLPCIQIKEKYGREWLAESTDYRTKGRIDRYNEDLVTFTEVDYETFKENYDFVVHEWIYHYRFNLVSNADGQRFIAKYYKQKQDAERRMYKIELKYKDSGYLTDEDYIKAVLERQEAKDIMNSAYGKMATKFVLLSKNSEHTSEGVKFVSETFDFNKDPEDPSDYYIPYACFVTAYARQELVRAWATFKGRAIYCDTDSIHALGTPSELPSELVPYVDFDKTGELGLWKIEGVYTKARYIRSKAYIKVDKEGVEHIICAGAPSNVKEIMNWDNFRTGFDAWKVCEEKNLDIERYSKLVPKRYPSGVDLVPTNFTIK